MLFAREGSLSRIPPRKGTPKGGIRLHIYIYIYTYIYIERERERDIEICRADRGLWAAHFVYMFIFDCVHLYYYHYYYHYFVYIIYVICLYVIFNCVYLYYSLLSFCLWADPLGLRGRGPVRGVSLRRVRGVVRRRVRRREPRGRGLRSKPVVITDDRFRALCALDLEGTEYVRLWHLLWLLSYTPLRRRPQRGSQQESRRSSAARQFAKKGTGSLAGWALHLGKIIHLISLGGITRLTLLV